MEFRIEVAQESDFDYNIEISEMYKRSAKDRGTGIALRTPEYIKTKIAMGNSIMAKFQNILVGFCYIETFSSGEYVSNSGLIVKPEYRGHGIAKAIKKHAVALARKRYPEAKLFGITTSDAVMKINSDLGYIPVSFSKLTQDEEFWKGCSSCRNFDILTRNDKKLCLCTAMMAPSKIEMLEKMEKLAKQNEQQKDVS